MNEIEFINEVIEQLGHSSYEINESNTITELTNENIFMNIQKHEKHEQIYSQFYIKEIDYISSHFYEFYCKHESEILKLKSNTIFEITNNEHLKIQDEDQLLRFINKLYKSDKKYFQLYENVIFINATTESIKEFIEIFDFEYLTYQTWLSISERLCSEIKNTNKETSKINNTRYKILNQKQLKSEIEETSQIKTFKYVENQEFKGIFNYLTKSSNGNIHDKGIINITSNYINSNHPKNLLDFNENNYYSGKFKQDCWTCFDFKDKEIEISHYSIKSAVSPGYLKNWVNGQQFIRCQIIQV